jgi:hypothetical protein
MANRLRSDRHRAVKIIFSQIKGNAKSRNLHVTITEADVEKYAFDECSYCGASPSCRKRIPILKHGKLIGYRKGAVLYNSIDRIDNTKGYTPENITTACLDCQIAKSDLTLFEFFSLAERLSLHLTTMCSSAFAPR